MKKFNIYDYDKKCPLARQIEKEVNNITTPSKMLSSLKNITDADNLHLFFLACILYWAETDRYDDRNKWAVFVSREIAKDFPQFEKLEIPDELLKEAYAFTSFAHRYLQNTLFNVILESFKQDDRKGIYTWFEQTDFVYDKTGDTLIRYKEYKEKYIN